MPEAVTATMVATAAAAAKAAAFPTTLLLLFFSTPPANGPKNESTSLWTLQSTSQFPTQSPEMCNKLAWDMINEVAPVRTLTVRAYCLCPAGNGTDLCFNEEQARVAFTERKEPVVPTTVRIGPDTFKRDDAKKRRGPATP